jgi:hypothetical protein
MLLRLAQLGVVVWYICHVYLVPNFRKRYLCTGFHRLQLRPVLDKNMVAYKGMDNSPEQSQPHPVSI